ncbi:thiamine phosphate synthase [Metabacillus sp. 84]|uniref:thiamine phosphate synthase n=1 Tax=unclassified Metabacillus TaxID=2675274 RepID=UPI003CF3ED27
MEFHAVTNGRMPFPAIAQFMKEAGSVIDFLHIREKEKTEMEIYEGTAELIRNGVPSEKLIVNGRPDIAAAAGVRRVQLGYRNLSPSIVKRTFPSIHAGRSVHSLDEALEAQNEGADSVLFGHLFPTDSKKGLPPQGIGKARELSELLSIDVLVIGGIEPAHLPLLSDAKVKGFLVMSGIWDRDDPVQAACEYREANNL